MIRRTAVGALVAVAALSFAAMAAADVPAGPRLAFVRLLPRRLQLVTASEDGAESRVIAGGGQTVRPLPAVGGAPAWSPDGSLIVFSAYTGKLNGSASKVALFVAAADGSGSRRIPDSAGASDPVFSPDGHTVAFARERVRRRASRHGGTTIVFESTSVWLADLGGGASRRITPWRNRLWQVPSSFSPDASRLAVTRQAGDKAPEAIALSFDGSASEVIGRNAIDPVFSPDGSRIAFLRGPVRTFGKGVSSTTVRLTDLYVKSAAGGGLRRLTRTPRGVELAPDWDPSGQRLAYTQVNPLGSGAALLGLGDAIMQVNADGTCRTKVLSDPRAILYFAAWQPGPGREAGPIACSG